MQKMLMVSFAISASESEKTLGTASESSINVDFHVRF
jgi:hypothetical protein